MHSSSRARKARVATGTSSMPTARSRTCLDPGGHAAAGQAQGDVYPFIDMGDHVVVINAATVKLTGRKEEQKLYRRHSGFEGGLREERAVDVRKRQPIRLVEEALKSAVVSICMFHAGNTDNVIPQTAHLRGTARSLTPEIRDLWNGACRRSPRVRQNSLAPAPR